MQLSLWQDRLGLRNLVDRQAQEIVLGLTVPAKDTVMIGFVGLGMRGSSAVPRFTHIPGVKIVAQCDVVPLRKPRKHWKGKTSLLQTDI